MWNSFILFGKCIPYVPAQPKTSYTYTGKEIVAFEDDDYLTVWGTGKATEVGQYTVVLMLKENYCWEDGSTENKIITWEIN